jgi:anti-anti-sigma factor
MNNNAVIDNFDVIQNKYLKIVLNEINEDTIVLYLRGFLDSSNAFFFKEKLAIVVASGYTNILFNMRELSHVATKQVVIFTDLLRDLQVKGGDVVLVDLQSKVMKSFMGLGYSEYFKIVKTLDDGLDYIEGNTEDLKPIVVPPKLITPLKVCPICDAKLGDIQPGYKYHCKVCHTTLVIDKQNKIFLE